MRVEYKDGEQQATKEGHLFRFVWSVRGDGADWWSDEVTIEVRAWSLKEAHEKFAAMPFFDQMGGAEGPYGREDDGD